MAIDRRCFLRTLIASFPAPMIFQLRFADARKSTSQIRCLLSDAHLRLPPALYLPASIPSGAISAPQLECPLIDYHDWKTWSQVGEAMQKVPICSMCQNWLPIPDLKLRSGTVAVAHFNNELIVYAELADHDIFNPVKANGVKAFDRGDVMEIFLRAKNENNYLEHHITPDNYVLQLRWPSVTVVEELVEDINRGKLVDYVSQYSSHIPIRSQTLVQPELSIWRILAIIPLELLTSPAQTNIPREWRFSFSRYDYARGSKDPVLSSTSALRAPNFHELTSWGNLSLV